jgi:hypothetical protein
VTSLPVFCACGSLVKYAAETRCEDCLLEYQDKHAIGKPTRVKTVYTPVFMQEQHDRRNAGVVAIFERAANERNSKAAAGR